MLKYLLTIPIAFMFSGCCISLFNDSCVIEVKVPGPTKLVYEKCELDSIPDEPKWYGEPISFKQIEFDDNVYYGITEDEAITLDINMVNERTYTKTLRATILKYTKEETK